MAFNPRIKERPELSILDGSMIAAIYDYATDTTYFTKLENIMPANNSNDYRWDTLTTYVIGDIVTYQGKIWQSLQVDNLNNIPFTGSAFWVEQSKSLGGLAVWQAGTFTDPGALVTSNITGKYAAYKLTQATPFVSNDFLAELKAGKWSPLSELAAYDYDGSASPIDIDALGSAERMLKIQDIDGARVWNIDNSDNLLKLTLFVNLTGGGGWDQDFSSLAVVSDNGNWDSGTKTWNPIQAGKYKLTLEWTGAEFFLSISNLAE